MYAKIKQKIRTDGLLSLMRIIPLRIYKLLVRSKSQYSAAILIYLTKNSNKTTNANKIYEDKYSYAETEEVDA